MKSLSKASSLLVAFYDILIAAAEASYATRNKRLPSDKVLETLGISKEQMVRVHL